MTEAEHELSPKRGTRHSTTVVEGVLKPGQPRLGRRECEPHSAEINYLFDVLSTNFPKDRAIWDLHHYFNVKGEVIDLLFDVSYFRDLSIPYELSSFKASKFGNRVPTMAANFLSRSTYNLDVGITAEQCRQLGIPVYVVFNAHLPKPSAVRTPFLKVYYLEKGEESYQTVIMNEPCIDKGDIDSSKLVDVRPDLLPFKLGIQKLNVVYDERFPRYRLVLVDRETSKLLLSRAELAEQRAKQIEQRLEESERRLEESERRLEEERQRTKQKIEELEAKLRQLEDS